MDLGLSGKGVVVTGASKGISKSIALAFAEEGANLSICARVKKISVSLTRNYVSTV